MATKDTQQVTFGDVQVATYSGSRKCCHNVHNEENGFYRKCSNTASYAIFRKTEKVYLCEVHCKDSVKEMADSI